VRDRTSTRSSRRSASASPAAPSSRRRRRAKFKSWSAERRAEAALDALVPLLELFSTVDDVFTEDDALTSDQARRTTIGRVYEQWKRTRAALDPEWHPDVRPRRPLSRRVGDRKARDRQISQVERELG
jgi:hypothetical protein